MTTRLIRWIPLKNIKRKLPKKLYFRSDDYTIIRWLGMIRDEDRSDIRVVSILVGSGKGKKWRYCYTFVYSSEIHRIFSLGGEMMIEDGCPKKFARHPCFFACFLQNCKIKDLMNAYWFQLKSLMMIYLITH